MTKPKLKPRLLKTFLTEPAIFEDRSVEIMTDLLRTGAGRYLVVPEPSEGSWIARAQFEWLLRELQSRAVVQSLNKNTQCDAIIGSEHDSSCIPKKIPIIGISRLEEWEISESIQVKWKPDEISELSIILCGVDEITLVDPYFAASERSCELIRQICEHANNAVLKIYVDNSKVTVKQRDWRKELQNNCHIIVYGVDQKRIHDRFLVTRRGAIHSGHGFSPGKATNLCHMSINDAHRQIGSFKGKVIWDIQK